MVFAKGFGNALPLIDAAGAAYQMAQSEGLSLAFIAGQSGRPQYWFAANILEVVDVLGQHSGETAHQVLTPGLMAGLTLASDMMAVVSGGGQPAFADLRVTSAAFERYMAWARTVS
jgi:hypothetical protein